jgi:general secretion pathway protein E
MVAKVATDTRQSLEKRLQSYLESQGYKVTALARITGKSGIEHSFEMLAQSDDGFALRTMVFAILVGETKESVAGIIFDFANKAYDAGIKDRVIVANPPLDTESRVLAQKQRIKVVEEEQLESFMSAPSLKTGPAKVFRFDNKKALTDSLVKVGYRIEENAKVIGRTGVEYTFDILAYATSARIARGMAIDIITGDKPVELERVAFFDAKAFDTGVDDKAIALQDVELSPPAKLFVAHQGIKILELGGNSTPAIILTMPMTPEPADKPAESGKPVESAKSAEPAKKPNEDIQRQLRQAAQPEAIQMIPEVLARRYNAIPISISGNTMVVAMADPSDILALEAFAVQSHKRIKPITATSKEIREAIDASYKGYTEIEKQVSSIQSATTEFDDNLAMDAATDTPLVQVLNLIVDEAVKARASDIHIEPQEKRLRIRYRIDGTLQDTMSLPTEIHLPMISRLKILSSLNIADHFHAQDGQFSTESKQRKIDIRVATSPTVYGEMAVLRLLDKSTVRRGLAELGFLPESLAKYEKLLKVPYGMMLVSGPTGAGKTTTLYASLGSLDTLGRNVITVEDPAEYRFEDINQIQVNNQGGITFASGLRSILRLDPDVILVGEIRDAETASIAVQAALTGHLLLSSIHANDTIGVIFRLMDLGVEPFLIASAVIGIVAQRMVRRVCPDCQHSVDAPLPEQLSYEKEMKEKRTKFNYATGCKTCAYTGYLGRVGIFEILAMTDTLRRLIINNAPPADIRDEAIKEGLSTMTHDGMLKVKMGLTTPTEIIHTTYAVE